MNSKNVLENISSVETYPPTKRRNNNTSELLMLLRFCLPKLVFDELHEPLNIFMVVVDRCIS